MITTYVNSIVRKESSKEKKNKYANNSCKNTNSMKIKSVRIKQRYFRSYAYRDIFVSSLSSTTATATATVTVTTIKKLTLINEQSTKQWIKFETILV